VNRSRFNSVFAKVRIGLSALCKSPLYRA